MRASTTESFAPKPPPDHRTARGRSGEDAAATLLEARGYEIVARNWRGGRGELDLICRVGKLLVFVEVRTTRSSAGFGMAVESLRPSKLYRLRSAGRAWLAEHGCGAAGCRFDFVALQLNRDGSIASAEVLEGIIG